MPLVDLIAIGTIIVLGYAMWFKIHFWYLPFTGEHGAAFMSEEFQSTLIGNEHYDVRSRLCRLLPCRGPWCRSDTAFVVCCSFSRTQSPRPSGNYCGKPTERCTRPVPPSLSRTSGSPSTTSGC